MLLKSTFLALKKVVQVVQIEARGGGLIWTKSKRTATFFRETIPYSECTLLFFYCITSQFLAMQPQFFAFANKWMFSSKKANTFFSNNYCVQLLSWFSLYCLAPKYFDPSTVHVNDKSCHCQLLAILLHSTNIFFKIAQILQLIQSQILAVLSHPLFLPRLVLFKPPHKCTSKCAGKSPAKANF